MGWSRFAVPAIALAGWLAGAAAQQPQPPAGTPPASTPPAATPPPGARPPPAEPPEPEPKADTPPAKDDEDDGVEVPTELQPDAAVTFPVDI